LADKITVYFALSAEQPRATTPSFASAAGYYSRNKPTILWGSSAS
jgi:hypothetical protein